MGSPLSILSEALELWATFVVLIVAAPWQRENDHSVTEAEVKQDDEGILWACEQSPIFQALDGRENDEESVPLFSYQRLILGWLQLRKVIFSFLRSSSHHLLSRKMWAVVTATRSTKTFLWKLERKTLYFSFNCLFIPSVVQCILQSAPHMAIKPHNIPPLRKGCHTDCLDRKMEINSSKHLASHPTVNMWHKQKWNPGILAL